MEGRSLSGYQHNRVWLNDGAGKFREVAAAVGGALQLDSRAVAFADLDNDGTLEILVATQGGPLKIYRTVTGEDNNWIGFRLEGSQSNRSAIGARVKIIWDGARQVQAVQSASGFSSQNQRPLHFGLGTAEQVDRVVLEWPSGKTDTLEYPEINKMHTITETTPQL